MSRAQLQWWQRELADFTLWVGLVVLIPLGFMSMGWRPHHLIVRGDGPHYFVPMVDKLLAVGGNWLDVLYRGDLAGGSPLMQVMGTNPTFFVSGWLGLDVVTTLNICIFFALFLSAALNIKIVQSLLNIGEGTVAELSPLQLFLLSVVFAFSPLLAWRVQEGHFNLLFGLLTFTGLLATYLSLRARTMTLSFAIICFLALVSGLSTFGYQMMFYSLVFAGIPTLVLVFWQNSKRLNKSEVVSISMALGLFVIALFYCLPWLGQMISHSTGSDALRGEESLVFSYRTSSFIDYLQGLLMTWDPTLQPNRPGFNHELNYPLGCTILAIPLLVKFKSYRPLGYGVVAALLLALGFSLNWGPVVSVITSVVPPMRLFRVPARAMLVVGFVLLPLFCALLLRQPLLFRNKWGGLVANLSMILLFVASLFLPVLYLEILLWLLVMVWLVNFSKIEIFKYLPMLALTLLAVVTVKAFHQRVLLPGDLETGIKKVKDFGSQLRKQFPSAENPLERVSLEVMDNRFGFNIGHYLGISSIESYFMPQRRFSQLFQALEKIPFKPTAAIFYARKGMRSYPVISKQYNIVYQVRQQNGRMEINRLQESRAVWAPTQIETVSGVDKVAARLQDLVAGSGDRFYQSVVIDPDDKKVSTDVSSLSLKNCQGFLPQLNEWKLSGQELVIDTPNGNNCLLVVATNYSDFLKAHNTGNMGQELELMPVNGAVVGIVVPPEVTSVTLKAEPMNLSLYSGLHWLALIMLAGWLFLTGSILFRGSPFVS